MKNMYRRLRRWPALALALALTLSLLPMAAAEGPTNQVTLNGSTYTVQLGKPVDWWDETTDTPSIRYRPYSVERGIISDSEKTQWDYYVLLLDSQGQEADEAVYGAFWDAYSVTVSAVSETGGEPAADPPVVLTKLTTAEDGYRKYVNVTVTGPWSGSIDVTFTPVQGDTGSGTGGRTSGWVSIQQAMALTLDDSGNGTFSVDDAESNKSYYFYVSQDSGQSVTVSGELTNGTGGIYLMIDDGRRRLYDNRNGVMSSSETAAADQPLLFAVEASEGGSLSGTITVDSLPQYGFYSAQVRDSSHYLERIVYSENQTVWLMSKDGFTSEEVQNVAVVARSGNQQTPITVTSVQRAGTTDRYDIQVTVPQVDMYDYLFLEAAVNGRVVTGCEVSLTRPGNSLFWGNYAVGFAFQMGDVLDFNDGDMLMGQTRPPEGDGSYVPFHDTMVAVGEKKTDAAGGIYYEVAENMSVTVEQMWIETVSGPANTLSFSQSEPVTKITNPAATVPVYSRNDQACAAVIKAEVAVYDRSGGLITSGTVSIRAAQEIQTVQNVVRPADDTTEALNQALEELAQTLDRDAVCTIQLGKEYHGTILIPQEFEHARITITGEANKTRICGGIDLCGGRVDVIREISFFHSDNAADATTSALWGGWCGNVIQCVFSGYPVAADATTGFLAFTNGNVFVDNQIGVKVDLSGTQQGGNQSPWQYNTFLRNGTAVQVLGFNSIMSPYYFRIVDSNFIGNSTDFDLQAPGTVYLYRNYFGKIHPQAEDRELLDFLTALLSADDKSLHQIVTSNAPRIETGSGSRVVTNPRWKNPEANWWRRSASLEEIFGSGNGGGTSQRPAYENYLTSDWDRATEIVNEEADQLVMDAAAFTEAEGKKEIDVVDQNGNSLGSWTFD